MDKIDKFSVVPLYQQLAAILARQIESGEIPPLTLLPSESTLSQEHEVGRDTVRAALALLREQGLAFTLPQRGTYAGQPPKPRR